MIEPDPKIIKAIGFYLQHYAWIRCLALRPGERIVLGDKKNQVCRFCGRSAATVPFQRQAHAIPESLGNKSLFTNYECDCCNKSFGDGIENDLGNWSKPYRTFARIRGKKGVPTLKKGGPERGWRIEYDSTGFHIEQYENDPIFVVDEEKKQVRFELERDAYTPVAVLKAFVKIGLTLLPVEELPHFSEALAWIREDHTKSFVKKCTMVWTFRPGPMPNDLVVVMLLRRKTSVTDVPYAVLVLAYGNDMFQVSLPSPKQDSTLYDQELTLPAFQMPGGPNPTLYGKVHVEALDLCGREKVKGEQVPIQVSCSQIKIRD